MYAKKGGRVTFRTNRRNYKRSSSFSNGKSRNKGNVMQQFQKYTKLAKEAFSTGDRIQTEYYYQFADHYSRLMIEMGIGLDDNEINETKNNDQHSSDVKVPSEDKNFEDEKPEPSSEELSDKDHESIESVPFISEPVKKKSTKSKKDTA